MPGVPIQNLSKNSQRAFCQKHFYIPATLSRTYRGGSSKNTFILQDKEPLAKEFFYRCSTKNFFIFQGFCPEPTEEVLPRTLYIMVQRTFDKRVLQGFQQSLKRTLDKHLIRVLSRTHPNDPRLYIYFRSFIENPLGRFNIEPSYIIARRTFDKDFLNLA